MKAILRQQPVEVTPTPKEMAELIWSMNSGEQVEMLNELAALAGHLDCLQLQAITDDNNLTQDARFLMAQIGNYSERNQ